MGKILYIRGSACPYTEDKINWEDASTQAELTALRDAGHQVVEVGDVRQGFSLDDIAAGLQRMPRPAMVIVHAHGNIDQDKHFLQRTELLEVRQDGRLWASDFYEALAAHAKGPLNVFMFSCGSGNGCLDAARILPRGSTLVNFTQSNELDSYVLDARAFGGVAPGRNLAERFFLNMLCLGHAGRRNKPQITISDATDPLSNTCPLWDVVRSECLDGDEDTTRWQATMNRRLSTLLSQEQIAVGTHTIQLYARTAFPIGIGGPGTPIKLKTRVDLDDLLGQAADHDILGAMYAMAYMHTRRNIGAFQSWPKVRYQQPQVVRPIPDWLLFPGNAPPAP